MESLTFTIELEPVEAGGFAVRVPALPGCVTWGRTLDEAQGMAREAIELWLETLLELGEPIPEETTRPVTLGIQVRRPTVS